MEEVVHVELLAIRAGTYSLFVFQNLTTGALLMCTRLPNWESPNINIGERGYLKYKEVKAGEEYYNPDTGEKQVYKYTNIYFMTFVKEADIIANNTTINL